MAGDSPAPCRGSAPPPRRAGGAPERRESGIRWAGVGQSSEVPNEARRRRNGVRMTLPDPCRAAGDVSTPVYRAFGAFRERRGGSPISAVPIENFSQITLTNQIYKLRFVNQSTNRCPMTQVATSTPHTTPTMLNFPPPLHLKHRPVAMLPYEAFDGRYAGETDAKYLSLGLAQWNNSDAIHPDMSVKVWRYPDNKWSRMSEELPLHRVVDLCLLLVKVLSANTGPVMIPANTFENQTEPLELNMLEDLPGGFEEQKQRVLRRLRKLRETLEATL